jgi:hypothetical protein
MSARRKILPVNRQTGKRVLLGRARAATIAVVSCAAMLQMLPAHALNAPSLSGSYPRGGGAVRTPDTGEVRATYDRALTMPPSAFTLRDAANALVGGTVLLVGPNDSAGRPRSIALRPATLLTEAAGPYTATAHACPLVPGDCTDTTFSFDVDNTAPAAPVVTSPVAGSVAREQPVAVRGTAEVATLIRVFENDHLIAHDRTGSAGTFVVALPYPAEDGIAHDITVFASDEAGNGSPGARVAFSHDSIVVVPIITTPLNGSYFNVSAVTVAGTAKPNAQVEIDEGSTPLGTTTSNARGDWSAVVTFSLGAHTITATSYDGATFDGPSRAVSLTIDQTPPGAPVILTPSEGAYVNTRNVLVSGTAEADGSVKIRDGSVLRTSAPVDGTGAWSAVVSFTEGPHAITATATDAAGNNGPATTRNFTVDTTAPAIPTITTPAQNTYVNSASVVVAGQAEAGVTVKIRETNAIVGSAVASMTGTWSTAINFANGTHAISAIASDLAGNDSPVSQIVAFTVDTIPPSVPTITAPQEGANLSGNSVLVAANAEANTRIDIFEGTTLVRSGFADDRGIFSTTVTFANGPHVITARSTDAAGNVGPSSAPRAFSIGAASDTTPPGAPFIAAPIDGSVMPRSTAFRGTAEQGSNAKVYEGTHLLGTDDAFDGSWSVGYEFSTPGTHVVYARAVDEAGNVSAASPSVTFTVDMVRPTITFAGPDPTVFLPTDTATFTGAADDDFGVDHIDVEVDDKLTNVALFRTQAMTCVGCPGTHATWESTVPLQTGLYRMRAYAVDRAGNRSEPVEITVLRI